MLFWRHIHKSEKEKKKGPVGPEKEEEVDKLERLFCLIYEFHNPVQNTAPVFVPAELPPRYAINFLPATSACSVNSGDPVFADDPFFDPVTCFWFVC